MVFNVGPRTGTLDARLTMTTEQRSGRRTVSVELYCQPSTSAVVPLDRHHRRLTDLASAGVVDSVDVSTWPGRVTLESQRDDDALDGDRGEAVRLRREFEAWADAVGVSLAPAFGRHSYESTYTDTDGVALRFPVVAMAVRANGDLRAVYPHTDRDQVTVAEGVRRLAADERETAAGAARSAGD